MSIEHRADLEAAKECEEHIDTEYPSDRALTVIFQLMLTEVLMEYADGIPAVSLAHRSLSLTPIRNRTTHIMPKPTTDPMKLPNTTSHAFSPPSG